MSDQEAGFTGAAASRYEAWYTTPEGRRADRLEKASLRRLLDLFPGACSVLEVGAGTGHFTRWLSDEGWAAAGLDRSASMLWQARRLDESQLVQGDALRLPFREDAFDLVAFITVLEFVEQRRDVLLEALRVARHGLVLGILNRCSVLGLQRRLTSLFRRTTYDEARFPSVPEMKRLLKSVADDGARIVWHTTLLPRCCSWSPARLPWGAFIAMALVA